MITKIKRFFFDKSSRYRMKRRFIEIFFRKRIVEEMQNTLCDNNFSIISSDCVGGLIYHDLKMQFLSPTINMAIPAHSFIKLCSNLNYYMTVEPVEVETEKNYPVMRIDDVILECMHYSSFEEARNKWILRRSRINYDNLFMIFSAKDGFDETLLPEIDVLPFKKVLFSNKKYKYNWCCYLKEFGKEKKVGDLTRYVGFLGWKYYDKHFNYVKWFNGASTRECIK